MATAEPVLCAAQLSATSIDVIIVATYADDHPLPSTALIVKDRLNGRNALPLDVTQAACTNGLQAMLLAAPAADNGVNRAGHRLTARRG